MKKLLSILALASISSTVFAQSTDNDTVKYSTDVPQFISVNSPNDPAVVAANSEWGTNVAWVISSNNAFNYSFSGNSKDDDGNDLGYPAFYKQDVDASGNVVPNNYDVLDTDTAVDAADYQSISGAEKWNPSYAETNNVAKLVKPTNDPESPYATIGRIMPGDDTSEATIELWMRGNADQFDQSGLYNAEVMITVTADEQEV